MIAAGSKNEKSARSAFGWLKRHRKTTVAGIIVAAFVLLNVMTAMHAYRMTHFTAQGTRTKRIESLSVWEKAGVILTGVRVPKPVNTKTPGDFDLKYEVHRFGGPDEADCEGWYVPRPDASAIVVMLPGYSSSKDDLLPVARIFHDLSYAVWLIDFRGCGGSHGNVTTLGYLEAEDTAAAVAYARRTFEPRRVVVYGFSMGGVAALRAAAEGWIEPDAMIVEAPFDRLVTTIGNRFRSMGLPSFPSAQLMVFWGGVQHGYWGFSHNPSEYAQRVHCPVLVIGGENDPRSRPQNVRAVYDQLAGTKEFELFADTGHQSPAVTKPEAWKQAVTRFLASLDENKSSIIH